MTMVGAFFDDLLDRTVVLGYSRLGLAVRQQLWRAPELPAGGDAESWVATAVERNPTLQAAGHAVRAAEHGVQTARGGHLPSLSLSAGYNNDTGWDNIPGPAASRAGSRVIPWSSGPCPRPSPGAAAIAACT